MARHGKCGMFVTHVVSETYVSFFFSVLSFADLFRSNSLVIIVALVITLRSARLSNVLNPEQHHRATPVPPHAGSTLLNITSKQTSVDLQLYTLTHQLD